MSRPERDAFTKVQDAARADLSEDEIREQRESWGSVEKFTVPNSDLRGSWPGRGPLGAYMILYDLADSEESPAYKQLDKENRERQYDFLTSIIRASLTAKLPMISTALIKALNYHAVACLHATAGEYRTLRGQCWHAHAAKFSSRSSLDGPLH